MSSLDNLSVQHMTRTRKRAAGLAELSLTEASLVDLPEITTQITQISRILSRVFTRPVNIGRTWTTFLAQSDDPVARALLSTHRTVRPCYAPYVPIEAYCLAAGVPVLRLLEIITGIAVRLGAQASTLVAALAQPRIVEVLVASALQPDGFADRREFLKATGFIPTPKTSVSIVNAPRIEVTSATQVTAPPAERTIRNLVDSFNVQPALPSPTDALTPMVATPHTPDAVLVDEGEDEDDENE